MQIANPQTSGPNKLIKLADLLKCGNLRICYLRTQPFFSYLRFADSLFCRLKTSANLLKHNFLPTSKGIKCSDSNTYKHFTDQAWGRISVVFPLKWPATELFFEKRCFILAVLWWKIVDLQLADWNTEEICGFAIWGLTRKKFRISNLRTGTLNKFTDFC